MDRLTTPNLWWETRKTKARRKSLKGEEIFIKHLSIIMAFMFIALSSVQINVHGAAIETDNDNPVMIISDFPDLTTLPTKMNIVNTDVVEEPRVDESIDNIEYLEQGDVVELDIGSATYDYEYTIIEITPMVKDVPEGFIYTDQIPLSLELQQYIYKACIDKGLEYELILALMWRESRFQVDAVGYNNNGTCDSGIMQINDCNRGWLYREYGIDNLLDPYQNIDAGTNMLGILTEKYGAHNALMAYQYGEAGMNRKFAQGIYTNDSIANLMVKRNEFRNILQAM